LIGLQRIFQLGVKTILYSCFKVIAFDEANQVAELVGGAFDYSTVK